MQRDVIASGNFLMPLNAIAVKVENFSRMNCPSSVFADRKT